MDKETDSVEKARLEVKIARLVVHLCPLEKWNLIKLLNYSREQQKSERLEKLEKTNGN